MGFFQTWLLLFPIFDNIFQVQSGVASKGGATLWPGGALGVEIVDVVVGASLPGLIIAVNVLPE